MEPEKYHNHSGGAMGADSQWDDIGRQYGVVNHHHYWYGKMNPRSKKEDEITTSDFFEGKEKVILANKSLHRYPDRYMNLLARNWLQVKNSEAVYAIGTLRTDREVNGGTGWAVQMAIDSKKPVFVFDQERIQWFEYSFESRKFIKSGVPTLTVNFAGIGTRGINENGPNAIKEVYEKTFNKWKKK